MKMMYAMVLAFVMVAFVGCSKDDDGPSGGSIDAAVGTFKGKIKIPGVDEIFNQTLTVTKVSDGVLKAEVADKSLKLPVKQFNVTNSGNLFISADGISTEGSFIYDIKNKSLVCQGEPTSEGEVFYTFEGTKQ